MGVLTHNVGSGAIVGDNIENGIFSICGCTEAKANAANFFPNLCGKVADGFAGVDGLSSREVVVFYLTLPTLSSTSWLIF